MLVLARNKMSCHRFFLTQDVTLSKPGQLCTQQLRELRDWHTQTLTNTGYSHLSSLSGPIELCCGALARHQIVFQLWENTAEWVSDWEIVRPLLRPHLGEVVETGRLLNGSTYSGPNLDFEFKLFKGPNPLLHQKWFLLLLLKYSDTRPFNHQKHF